MALPPACFGSILVAMTDQKPEPDENAKILRAVEELTNCEPVSGGELFGDSESARKFREAKKQAESTTVLPVEAQR